MHAAHTWLHLLILRLDSVSIRSIKSDILRIAVVALLKIKEYPTAMSQAGVFIADCVGVCECVSGRGYYIYIHAHKTRYDA